MNLTNKYAISVRHIDQKICRALREIIHKKPHGEHLNIDGFITRIRVLDKQALKALAEVTVHSDDYAIVLDACVRTNALLAFTGRPAFVGIHHN